MPGGVQKSRCRIRLHRVVEEIFSLLQRFFVTMPEAPNGPLRQLSHRITR
jgi:hypothetical protein